MLTKFETAFKNNIEQICQKTGRHARAVFEDNVSCIAISLSSACVETNDVWGTPECFFTTDLWRLRAQIRERKQEEEKAEVVRFLDDKFFTLLEKAV